MDFQFIEYVTAERPQYPNTLRIDSSGSAHAEQRFSGAMNSLGDIGYFESKLSRADVGELSLLVQDERFHRAPDDAGKLLPGASHRIVRVQEQSAAIEKTIQWEKTPEPVLARLFGALDRSLDRVRSSPIRVLRVQLTAVNVDRQGSLSAVLTLTNPGPKPVRVRSPLAMGAGSGSGLQIEAWPDRAGVRAEDVVRAPVMRVENQTQLAEPAVIDLPPGQFYAYRVYASPQWRTREPHQVRLRYSGPTVASVEAELVGEAYTPVTQVAVP